MRKKSELIIHPVRMRLVAELGNRQMTTRQLAAALPDISQATLYRQIKILHENGIVVVANEQVVNGAVERTYALGAAQNRLDEDEIQSLSAEQHVQYFSIFAAGLIDAFERYATQSDPVRFPKEGMSYNQAVIYLSDEERVAFQEKLLAVVGDVMAQLPAPNRKRFLLASAVIPK